MSYQLIYKPSFRYFETDIYLWSLYDCNNRRYGRCQLRKNKIFLLLCTFLEFHSHLLGQIQKDRFKLLLISVQGLKILFLKKCIVAQRRHFFSLSGHLKLIKTYYSNKTPSFICYYANLQKLQKSNHHIIYLLCLENGGMMTPKRRLSTLIFAYCLCFTKSLIIITIIIIIIIIIIKV